MLDALLGQVNADGTTLCPLCRRLTRTTDAGLLYRHYRREQSFRGFRSVVCKTSRHTPEEALRIARREAAELDALRLRAHP